MHDGLETMIRQRNGLLLRRRLLLTVLGGGCLLLDFRGVERLLRRVLRVGETPQRGADEATPIRQVTARDGPAVRVRAQPALPRPDELVDLVRRHPVVL